MSNWIDKYKKLVVSSYKPHVVIADMDGLFAYSELKQALENEGYRVIVANSDLEVRVQFELNVRDSENKYLIIAPAVYSPMPDVALKVHFVAISLQNIFPNLDSKAIKGLSFNALCLLSNIKPYEDLGHEKTLKFLLENLYNVDFDSLTVTKAKEKVFNALITVLLEKNGINQPLSQFLAGIARPYFPNLVKAGLTTNNLVKYIQEEWQNYVATNSSILDFKEPLLSKSLGYLFAFDYVKPVKVTQEKYDGFPKFLKIGLFTDSQENNDNELEGLIDYLKQHLDTIEDIPEQWFKVIQVFASAKLKSLVTSNTELIAIYLKLEIRFNNRFQRFIDNTYGSLFSLSGVRKPVVVSRILEHLNAQPAKRKALLVIDGMNYWQWALISKALSDSGISSSPGATLAYIPSITAWSRQAILKGVKPDLSTDNSKEEKLFESYWLQHCFNRHQIQYRKIGVNEPNIEGNIPSDVTMLALVCNDLDEIMHGAILGNAQLMASTKQWIEVSKIISNIKYLLSQGFQLYVTADHGSIEATGISNLKLKDKVGSLSRSKRHLQFTNEVILNSFIDGNVSLVLGKRNLSVYLKNQEAFTNENKQVITHGGSHFWEVVVPFILING